MFTSSSAANSSKSPDSLLELFQHAAQARAAASKASGTLSPSSSSSPIPLDSPSKRVASNDVAAKGASEDSQSLLKQFILSGTGKKPTPSSSSTSLAPAISTTADDASVSSHLLTSTASLSVAAGSVGSNEAVNSNGDGNVLVQFKKPALNEEIEKFSGMISHCGIYLAYIVNERKVRILNLNTGNKGSFDRHQGSIVGISWNHENNDHRLLAILSEDGEITIGKVIEGSEEGRASLAFTDSQEARPNSPLVLSAKSSTVSGGLNGHGPLNFAPISIVSFPEIGRARGMVWSSWSPSTLAVFGESSSEVFFLHLISGSSSASKTSFLNSDLAEISNIHLSRKHGDDQDIWIIGAAGNIELFRKSVSSSTPLQSYLLSCAGSITCSLLIEGSEGAGLYAVTVESDALDVLKVYQLKTKTNDNGSVEEIREISSVQLEGIGKINQLKWNEKKRLLLAFNRSGIEMSKCCSVGEKSIFAISLKNPRRPRVAAQLEVASNGVLLDACFVEGEEKEYDDGELVYIYANDSIMTETIAEVEDLELEEEEDLELEDEVDEVVIDDTEEESIQDQTSGSSSLFKKDEIKALIRESFKEVLSEVLADAVNSGIKAGLEDISRQLNKLVLNLLSSEVSAAGNESEEDVAGEVEEEKDDGIVDLIESLLAENRLLEALNRYLEALAPSSDTCTRSAFGLLIKILERCEDPFTVLDEGQLSQAQLVQILTILLSADAADGGREDVLDFEFSCQQLEVQLNWLQELLIQIDFSTAIQIEPQLGGRCDGFFLKLTELINDARVDVNLQKKMKTVMRLLRKFQL